MTQPAELTEAEKQRLTRLVVERADELYVDTEDMTFVLHREVQSILEKRLAERLPIRVAELDLPPDGRPAVSYWPEDNEAATNIVRAIPAKWEAERTGTIELLRCRYADVDITVYVSAPKPAIEESAPYATAILNEAKS